MARQRGWVLATFLIACAPWIPKELINARSAYDHAMKGPAQVYAPDELASARESLRQAEQSFDEEGASERTRILALDADRKATMATTTCSNRILSSAQPIVSRELVKEEKLISLPAMVLFAYNEAKLLPAAKKHLEAAATQLKQAQKLRQVTSITIEGHTDDKGSSEYNMELSERRAQAVRDFLVGNGFEANVIQVRARGEEAPATSNDTDEGRATNRRVDILIGEKKSGE